MAGAGKSTVGAALSRSLGWPQLDTDSLLEAYFGAPLQEIFHTLGYSAFLQAEEELTAGLNINRCIISTGGSVVYGERAVRRLKSLGPVVFLQASLALITARVDPGSHRGLAIRPGQTLEELYAERQPLYEAAADFSISIDGLGPDLVSGEILRRLGLSEQAPATR